MPGQRMAQLQDALGLSGRDIAERAGFSPSIISALKSGRKRPVKGSSTIAKYTAAVLALAKERGKTEALAALLGADTSANDESFKTALLTWLYDNRADMMPRLDPGLFGENLRRLLSCLDLTALELSKLTDISKSHLSRFINNERDSAPTDAQIKAICDALVAVTLKEKRFVEVARLIECPLAEVKNYSEYYRRLCVWLCYPKETPDPTITDLLLQMRDLSLLKTVPLPSVSKILDDPAVQKQEAVYYDAKGIQTAVLRFLGAALDAQRGLSPGKTAIYLYSDQNMDWMIADEVFRLKWVSLMSACVMSGVKIKIIHNIDRSLSEMTEAIKNWLPLYLTGMIEPYYSRLDRGNSFTTSLFLSPYHACIDARNPAASGTNGIYRYDTDKKLLRHHKKQFSVMLANSKPLLTVTPGRPDAKTAEALIHPDDLPGIGILSTGAKAVVVKETAPQASFTFYHPMMKRAFQEYLKTQTQ